MSTGELAVFGSGLPLASSLAHIAPSLRFNNAFLQQREQHKCVLPPRAADGSSSGSESSCVAVRRLLSGSLVLLEDGQIVSLDGFACWRGERDLVAEAFAQLNALQLPIIDVAIGGHRAPSDEEEARVGSRSGAAGSPGSHFVALTAAGEVFVFGRNERGQLGLGHTRGPVTEPTRVPKFAPPNEEEESAAASSNIKLASRAPLPTRIVAVAAGRAHSLALTSDGSLYAWGRDQEGQCALSIGTLGSDALRGRAHSTTHLSMHVTPRFVQHLQTQGERVRAIAAANHVSLVLTESGQVWHWGYGLAKGQLNAPELVQFEDQQEPVTITGIAVGHSHALLLSAEGDAYSFGLGLTGALGHAFPEPQAHAPRLLSARRIAVGDEDDDDDAEERVRVVQVFAGAFYSALLDSRGQVWAFGSGAGGKLGLVDEVAPADSSSESSNVYVPTLVRALSSKTVSMLSLDAERMLAFVPTRLSAVLPGVVQLSGGTALTVAGAGFFFASGAGGGGGGGATTDPDNNNAIVLSFSYLGTQVRVRGTYDPVEDVLRAVVSDLRSSDSHASSSGGGGGGVKKKLGASYRNGHLENCVLRASMDGGAHFSNALSLHVFSPPDFAVSKKKSSSVAVAEVVPAAGPVQGGSQLRLHARFDAVPYERILVRFRVQAEEEASESGVNGAVIGTVEAEFDPVASCIHCVAPELPVALIPPSVPAPPSPSSPLSPSGKPSRFVRPPVVPPPRSLIPASLEVSLDGQNFFRFGASYSYYAVTASSVSPAVIGVAGADIELAARGVHYTQPGEQLRLRFSVGLAGNANYHSMDVPARFVPLQVHRDQARQERERAARTGRHARAEAAEAARVARLQAEREEEEARDPKEKAAAEKEKLRAEKAAQVAAEKASAAAAVAGASRPGSSAPSRPMSGSSLNASKRPSSRGGLATKDAAAARDASPSPAVRPGTAERNAASAAAPAEGAEGASDPNASAAAQEPDEWSVLESRITAAEAVEDAQLALFSAADRAAVGFICARAPLFNDFGACTPALSVTLNGRDFTPLSARLSVSRPVPRALVPSCGPTSGGTVVQLSGDHFYFAKDIAVQLRPVAPAQSPQTATTTPPVASAAPSSQTGAAPAAASVVSAPGSASKPKSASGLKPRPGTVEEAAAPAALPSPPQTAQTVVSEFVAHAAPNGLSDANSSCSSSLRFQTPSWNTAGVASVHAAFEPESNAFSAGQPPLSFLYYDAAAVTDAHPLLVSQAGGTEVTLHGRGFVASECIKVRLVLVDEPEDPKKAHGAKPATAAGDPGDATPGVTSGRRKSVSKLMPAGDAALAATSAPPVVAAAAAAPVPFVDVVAMRDAHDSPAEEEEHARMLAQRAKKGSKASSSAGGKKGAEEVIEPEAATLSFVVPSALAFSAAFADGGLAANRALEVELALNGQQFAPTGVVLRFEKDNKKPGVKPKVGAEAVKKK